MLRSLVGSEMCIRDRVSTQSTGKGQKFMALKTGWVIALALLISLAVIILVCVWHMLTRKKEEPAPTSGANHQDKTVSAPAGDAPSPAPAAASEDAPAPAVEEKVMIELVEAESKPADEEVQM
eukprot:TRINITY_DN4596_c0_g7_i1.p2 TRINITY_DN4596_c0_g7~~TRINITY_DN4596_c0_g7_i1.p2  ORF type:complete len:138 (+),score=59.56 TRINITY_DN4596_c0_g7_i1:46-414(+)